MRIVQYSLKHKESVEVGDDGFVDNVLALTESVHSDCIMVFTDGSVCQGHIGCGASSERIVVRRYIYPALSSPTIIQPLYFLLVPISFRCPELNILTVSLLSRLQGLQSA